MSGFGGLHPVTGVFAGGMSFCARLRWPMQVWGPLHWTIGNALQGHPPGLVAWLIGAVMGLVLLGAGMPAWGQVGQAGSPSQVRHRIGIYVTDLHGFDLAGGTFGASFWIWAVGADAAQTLQTMEFPNSDSSTVRFENTASRAAVGWSQRKLTGTFRHHWDLGNYPFDRHALEILLEEGMEEEAAFTYEADAGNSGYGLRSEIGGWRIRSMRVGTDVATYGTNFGDPAAADPASHFTRFKAVLELERADWTGFAKLTAALYAGFLICVIGCLVPVNATTFAPRVTLLVASLFAMVINMRSASAVLGSEHGLTLIDKLHVAGLAYMVAIAAATVLVRLRLERTGEDGSRLARLDHWSCIVPAVLFVVVNAWLLLQAATER